MRVEEYTGVSRLRGRGQDDQHDLLDRFDETLADRLKEVMSRPNTQEEEMDTRASQDPKDIGKRNRSHSEVVRYPDGTLVEVITTVAADGSEKVKVKILSQPGGYRNDMAQKFSGADGGA